MNLTLRSFLWLVLALLVACAKKPAESAPELPAPAVAAPAARPEAPAAGSAMDARQMATLLGELTQAVRKYGAEKKRAPKDLNELVAAGYLPGVPAAPPGKKYAIDKQMQVYLVNQ